MNKIFFAAVQRGMRTAAMTAAAALALVAMLAAPLHAQTRSDPPPPGEYRVVNGKVDRGTYTGWRLFHYACYGCHGVGGVGTDIAPNLVERIKTMTPRAFATKVLTSYRIAQPASEGTGNASNAEAGTAEREAMIEDVLRQQRNSRVQIIMPAWNEDPDVNPHVLDLFAYLTARADGKIGPGKPQLIGSKKRRP
jgi:hypothetical protein